MVDLARKILLYDKLRFLITVGGVGFAVTLVLVQTGLFLGLVNNGSVTIDHMDAEIWVAARNTPNIDFARTFPDSWVNRVRSVPGVKRADNLMVWFIRMALPNGAQEGVEVYAMEHFTNWNMPWDVPEGNIEDLRRGRYLMLDDSAVIRCGPFAAGDRREFLGRRMKIIGHSHDALSFTTAPIGFLDLAQVQTFAPEFKGQTTYIVVKLEPSADRESVMREIRRRLPYVDVHSKEEWSFMCRAYWIINVGLGMNLSMSILMGCLIAIMVVAQTLYTSTMDHIKEFGTLKAIGASNGHIYGILCKQAAIAAVGGFLIGGVQALLLKSAMLKVHQNLVTTPSVWVATFVGTLVFCLAAALVSFRKVAKLDPAIVFRG